jgi:hypothetical protein
MQPPSPNKLNIEELIWKNKSINKKGKTIQRTRVSLSSLKTRMVGMGQHNKRQVWKNYKLNEKKNYNWIRVRCLDPNTLGSGVAVLAHEGESGSGRAYGIQIR